MLKDEYLTLGQSAEALKVTRQTIARWIKSGKIKTERVGREVLIHKSELGKYFTEKIRYYEGLIKHYRRRIKELGGES